MAREFNVLALVKGGERFVYVYEDAGLDRVIDAIRDHAADPRFRLNWFDASVLAERARQQTAAAPDRADRSPSRIG